MMNSPFMMPYDDHEPNPWYIYDYLFYFSPGSPEDSRYPFGLVYEWHLFDHALDPHNPYVFLQRHKDYLTYYGDELVRKVYPEIIRGGYDLADAKEDFQMLLQPILNHITRFAEGTWWHRNDPMQCQQCYVGLGLFYTLSCRLDANFDVIFQQYNIDLEALNIPRGVYETKRKMPYDTNFEGYVQKFDVASQAYEPFPMDLSDPDLNIIHAVVYFRRMRAAVLKWYYAFDAAETFFREDWCYYYDFWCEP